MAGKKKTLSAYEEGIIADLMLGSGVFHPAQQKNSKGMKAARKLERAGYLTSEEGVVMNRGDTPPIIFYITRKARKYYMGRRDVPGTVSYKRTELAAKRARRRPGNIGRRGGGTPPKRKTSEREQMKILRARLRDV